MEIGAALGRSAPAVRQLAHRAREHVQARRPRFDVDWAQQREVTERFLAAAAGGDIEGLMTVLAPDQPEPRFHLAEVMAVTGHTAEALQNLQIAVDLSRKLNPANHLGSEALTDPNFNSLHNLPEFQKIISPN